MHRKRFLTLITYHVPSIHCIVVNGRGVLLRHRVCIVYCSCKWRSSVPTVVAFVPRGFPAGAPTC